MQPALGASEIGTFTIALQVVTLFSYFILELTLNASCTNIKIGSGEKVGCAKNYFVVANWVDRWK